MQPADPQHQQISPRQAIALFTWALGPILTWLSIATFFRHSWWVERFFIGPSGILVPLWFGAFVAYALRLDAFLKRHGWHPTSGR